MWRWIVLVGISACAVEETPPADPPAKVLVQSAPPPSEPVAQPDEPDAPASTGATGSTSSTGATGATSATGEPSRPAALTRYLTGDDADATPALGTGALFLMGGGTDVDAAFAFLSARAPNGDVVVLRASGADGYNDYLFTDIGGFDSIETLMITTRALADDPYVVWRVEHAELVFMAGGAQDVYLEQWAGTALATAVHAAYSRGAVIGGTSAGAMVASDPVYAAYDGSITSAEALADPFDDALDLDVGPFALMTRTIVDTHFTQRNRMGRLVTFLARAYGTPLFGLGIDEKTAAIIEQDGSARLFGSGKVHVVYADHAPLTLQVATPLTYRHLGYRAYAAPMTVPKLLDANALTGEVDCVNGALQ